MLALRHEVEVQMFASYWRLRAYKQTERQLGLLCLFYCFSHASHPGP